MHPTVIEKSFCTTREAAILLDVSVGTVQLWVESGLLRAWKTAGGHRRVMRDSVQALLHKAPDQLVQPGVMPGTTRRLSILVAEDDPDLLRLYQVNLSRWAMQPNVTCVDNAFTAMLMLGRGGTDLLVTDLHMPKMDGFEMLRVLRKAPEMSRTTIIVVTGLDNDAITAKGGIPVGIEVLRKPVPFDRLLTIATVIASKITL